MKKNINVLNRKKILFTSILLLIIILPGCGKTKPVVTTPTNSTTSTSATSTKLVKMPDSETKAEYNFCESHGYELIIRFDKTTQSSKAYCRFPDTTECEAISYMRGECNQGNSSVTYEVVKVEQPIKTIKECPKNYDPVCGANGATFTNECIAASQNVKVVSLGTCQKNNDTTGTSNVQPNTNSISTSQPYWLPVITDMFLLEPKSTPSAFVDKCVFDTKTVYYASYGCANCEDVLYDADANLICYPNKDLTKDCPDYFNLNTKKSYCRRIWTDNR